MRSMTDEHEVPIRTTNVSEVLTDFLFRTFLFLTKVSAVFSKQNKELLLLLCSSFFQVNVGHLFKRKG